MWAIILRYRDKPQKLELRVKKGTSGHLKGALARQYQIFHCSAASLLGGLNRILPTSSSESDRGRDDVVQLFIRKILIENFEKKKSIRSQDNFSDIGNLSER